MKIQSFIFATIIMATSIAHGQEYGPAYIKRQVESFHRTMANRTTQFDCEKARADLAAEEEAVRRNPSLTNEFSNLRNIVAVYCSKKQGMPKAPEFPQQTLPDDEEE